MVSYNKKIMLSWKIKYKQTYIKYELHTFSKAVFHHCFSWQSNEL